MSAYGERHPWMGAISRTCTGRPFTVMGITGVICLAFAPGAFQLIGMAKVAGNPEESSDSYKARELVEKHFPRDSDDANFVLVIALKGKKKNYATSSMLSTGSSESGCGYGDVQCIHRSWQNGVWPSLLQGVRSAMMSATNTVHYERHQTQPHSEWTIPPVLELPGLTEFSFALNKSLSNKKNIFNYVSNATLWANGISSKNVVNKEGSATQITWQIKDPPLDKEAQEFSAQANDIAERLVRKYLPEKEIRWGIASQSALILASTHDTEKSSLIMDISSLPMAACVLGYVLKSARLLMVPATTMGVSITISFGIMFIVAQFFDVLTATPTIMMSISIAMSVDYCMFILTRFRLELLKSTEEDVEKRLADAMAIAIETGGWAVLVSGLTLATSFFVLIVFPIPGWQTYGVGGMVALVVEVIVHITVLPAYVQHMPDFFAKCVPSPAEREEELAKQTSASEEPQEDWSIRLWRHVASWTAEPIRGTFILIIVTAITASIGYRFPDLHLSGEISMYGPQNTDAWKGFELMTKQFGKGSVNPLQLITVVDGYKYDSFLQQTPWEDSQLVLESIVSKMPHTKGIKVSSLSYSFADGKRTLTPWSQVADCMELQNANESSCTALQASILDHISADKQAQLATITLGIDPASDPGQMFVKRTRDLLDKLSKNTALRFGFAGGGPEMADNCDKINDMFPWLITGTFVFAMLLLAVSFHSLVYPVTCMFTILLTIVFVYGLGVRTYQDDFLEWTGIQALRNRFEAFPYGHPLALFSIVTGLCLDYDIFLMTRITELRAEGLSAKDAIVEGVATSGGIITAAGLVMALAFAGLMYASTTYAANISGFFLAAAVLYDTFIVRTLVVPAITIMIGRWSWWPSDLAYDKTD